MGGGWLVSPLRKKYVATLLMLPVLILLWVAYRVGFLRKIREEKVPGTYIAKADWGSSSLAIARDHTFHQTVRRAGADDLNLDGTWRLASRSEGVFGTIALLPCFSVTHKDEGRKVDACYNSIQAFGLRGIEISADPDYGIAFRKQ
jgi:hypothetical protein